MYKVDNLAIEMENKGKSQTKTFLKFIWDLWTSMELHIDWTIVLAWTGIIVGSLLFWWGIISLFCWIFC